MSFFLPICMLLINTIEYVVLNYNQMVERHYNIDPLILQYDTKQDDYSVWRVEEWNLDTQGYIQSGRVTRSRYWKFGCFFKNDRLVVLFGGDAE